MDRRVLPLILAGAAVVMLSTEEVWACSCRPPGPACQEVHAADAVFAAEVLAVGPSRYQEPRAFSMAARARVRVLEIYRGTVPGLADVFTGAWSGDCGYPFTRGGRYVVYAVRDRDTGHLRTGSCMRTATLEDSAGDLPYLRRFGRESSAFGAVRGFVLDLRESVLRPAAIPDARVTVESAAGQRTEARSRPDGSYQLDLPAGHYDLRAEVQVGPHLPLPTYSVEVPGGGRCRVVEFHVLPNPPL